MYLASLKFSVCDIGVMRLVQEPDAAIVPKSASVIENPDDELDYMYSPSIASPRHLTRARRVSIAEQDVYDSSEAAVVTVHGFPGSRRASDLDIIVIESAAGDGGDAANQRENDDDDCLLYTSPSPRD